MSKDTRRYRRRVEAGQCVRCGTPFIGESIRRLCDTCRTVWSKWYKNRTPEQKANTLKASRKWRKKNPEKERAYCRRSAKKSRLMVLAHYGPVCTCCGETEMAFLTIDHIDGDGSAHRIRLFGSRTAAGKMFYDWIIREGFPTNLQILCWNCNCAKGYYGACPHKDPTVSHRVATMPEIP